MKKLLLLLTLVLAVFFVAQAANHRSSSFTAGSVATLAAASTNTGDALTVEWTNALSQVITNGTNASGIYFGPYTRDVYGFADANGNAGSAVISVTQYGSAATSTNALTFTFVRSTDGLNFPTNTTPDSTFSFSVTQAGTATTTTSTNVPTWFLTGAAKVRLLQIANVGAGPGTCKLTSLTLNGYLP